MNPLIDSVCIGCEATALFGKGMFGSLAVIRNAGKMWSWYPNLVDIHVLDLCCGSRHFWLVELVPKEDIHFVDPCLIKEEYDKSALGPLSLTKLGRPIRMKEESST